MAAFCAVPGAEVTHTVIERIEYFNAPPLANATVYDTLCLPSYSNHAAHLLNHAALIAELAPVSPSGCICGTRKAAALGFVNAAWILVSTPPLKAAYDANAAPGGFAAPFPGIPVPVAIDPPNIQPRAAQNGRRDWSPWNRHISPVKGTSFGFRTMYLNLSCRHKENSFWHSLTVAMGRHHSRWAETKAGTSWYYNDVTRARAGGVRHPRERLYDDLDQAAITRNAPSVLLQLAPAAVGPVQVPFFDVESELYQIVADAWGLELIVVFDAVREQRRRLTLVRGDHNARQIFLLREADGSYTPLQPAVRDPADWRYSFHIPTKRKSMPNVGEWQESARFRSPYYQLGANGHLRRPRLPILEQAVGLPHLANARGALETPERVEDDPTPPSTVPNAFVHGYLNTGNWM